jgi:hypothetical protein
MLSEEVAFNDLLGLTPTTVAGGKLEGWTPPGKPVMVRRTIYRLEKDGAKLMEVGRRYLAFLEKLVNEFIDAHQ